MENLIKTYNSYDINIENRDNMTREEVEHFEDMVKYYNDYQLMIQDKYKLIAYFDEDFEEMCDNQVHTIYHIVLENKNISDNYAIFANGVLAETAPEVTLRRMDNFEEVNSIKPKKEEKKLDYIVEKLQKYLNEKLDKAEDTTAQQIQQKKNYTFKRIKPVTKKSKSKTFRKI